MKMIPAIALAAVFGFAMPMFAGCGQSTGSTSPNSQTDSASSMDQATPAGAADGVRVSAIDVGKGDCILIQAGKSAALIDTGYSNTSDDVLSYLRGRGVGHLEFAVITHYDKDHIGGIGAIGKEIPIDTIYLPGYEGVDKNYRTLMKAVDGLGYPTRSVTEQLQLELGNALLTLFPSGVAFVPDAYGDEGNDNDLSIAASLINGKDSYLFAGDLEEEGIAAFLERGLGRFGVLKVPHHGEKSPLTDELIDDVRPQVAIITDGDDDPADKKTLKLLEESGADVYRTSTDGTIVIESNGTGTYTVS